MKKLVLFVLFNFIVVLYSFCQDRKSSIWVFKDEKYNISFDFRDRGIVVDTTVTYEGPIYLISLLNDSTYLRINYIMSNATFGCCDDLKLYREIEYCRRNGVEDRRGVVKNSNKYWSVLRDRNLEIVYVNCSQKDLEFFDELLNNSFVERSIVH